MEVWPNKMATTHIFVKFCNEFSGYVSVMISVHNFCCFRISIWFSIGGSYDPKLISAEKNNKFSYDHEDKVNEAILKELNRRSHSGSICYSTFIQFSLSTTVQNT